MSTDSPNTIKKLTGSFSSPEFGAQTNPTDLSMSTTDANLDAYASIATNEASSLTTTTENVTTTTTQSTTKKFTTNGIKFDSTRDSGFSDSIIEDTSSSSTSNFINKNFVARTEHVLSITNPSADSENADITLLTKCFSDKGQLKSVVEDINIIQPKLNDEKSGQASEPGDEANKDYITIVKTTKVTTKVKHVKSKSKGKNKKNKKKNGATAEKSSEEEADSNNATKTDMVTTTVTSQSTSTSAVLALNENGEQVIKEIQCLKENESNEDDESVENAKTSDDSQSKLEPALVININKSTEELVFEAAPNKKQEQPKLDITLLSTTTTTQDQQVVDLNSTVLDSEEILSTYSTNNNPNSPRNIEVDSSNQPPSAVGVLTDVTMSIANTDKQVEPKKEEASSPAQKENEKKEKKSSRFKLFSSKPKAPKEKTDKKEKEKEKEPPKSPKRKNDKSFHESPSKQLKAEDAREFVKHHLLLGADKFVLLDDEQKDRILYLKPQCIELLINEFVLSEQASENKTQLSYLSERDNKLKNILYKMVSRSLDILRHDRIESFDKLAAQLKDEYKIDESSNGSSTIGEISDNYFANIDSATSDLVFASLLRKSLIQDKLLLKLDLDKANAKPYEELIEFSSTSTSIKTTTTFHLAAAQPENNLPVTKIESSGLLATVEEVKQKQVKINELVEKLSSEETNNQEPKSVQLQSSNTNSNCGTTPPPTPQNELNNNLNTPANQTDESEQKSNVYQQLNVTDVIVEASSAKIHQEGERIVLDTVKEPPIVFPSELQTDKKESNEVKAVVVAVPELKVEVAKPEPVVEVKKGEEKPKKTKSKKSSFSCLSCAGGNLEKETATIAKSETKKVEKKKSKKLSKENTDVTEIQKSDAKLVSPDYANKTPEVIEVRVTQRIETFEMPNIMSVEVVDDNKSPKADESAEPVTPKTSPKPIYISETLELTPVSLGPDGTQTNTEIVVNTVVTLTEKLNENDGLVDRLDSCKCAKLESEEKKITALVDNKKANIDKTDITVTKIVETKVNIVTINKIEEAIVVSSEEKQNLVEQVQETPKEEAQEPEQEEVKETKNGKKNKKKNKKGKKDKEIEVTVTKQSVDVSIIETKEEEQKIVEAKQDEVENQVEAAVSDKAQADAAEPADIQVVETETKIFTNNENTIKDEIIEISKVELVEEDSAKKELDEEPPFKLDEKIEPAQVEETKAPAEPEVKVIDLPNIEIEVKKPEVAVEVKPADKPKEKKQPKEKKVKEKKQDDDGSKVSCFSCKSRKAKKESQKEAKPEAEPAKTEVAVAKTPVVAHKEATVIDKNLFVGLDAPAGDKVFEIPSICSIELAKPSQTITVDSTKNLVELSGVGSIKEGEELLTDNNNNEIQAVAAPDVTLSDQVEPAVVEIKETIVVETEINEANLEVKTDLPEVNIELPAELAEVKLETDAKPAELVVEPIRIELPAEPKKLSDDVVVLPDPNQRTEAKLLLTPVVPIEVVAKPETPKPTEKTNKKSSVSCFSCRKQKSKEKSSQPAPTPKPVKVKQEKKAKTAQVKVDAEPVPQVKAVGQQNNLEIPLLPEATISLYNIDQSPSLKPKISNQPDENWARGLDRKENEPLLVREPEITGIVNMDFPCVIDIESIRIVKEEQKPVEKVEIAEHIDKIEVVKEPEQQPKVDSKPALDLSGAYIVIDRQPDHAVIPIVAREQIITKVEHVETEAKQEAQPEAKQTKKSKAKVHKTSKIDLPLINILVPSSSSDSKKKEKKKSKDKKPKQEEPKLQPKPESSIEPEQPTKETGSFMSQLIDKNNCAIEIPAGKVDEYLPELKLDQSFKIEKVEPPHITPPQIEITPTESQAQLLIKETEISIVHRIETAVVETDTQTSEIILESNKTTAEIVVESPKEEVQVDFEVPKLDQEEPEEPKVEVEEIELPQAEIESPQVEIESPQVEVNQEEQKIEIESPEIKFESKFPPTEITELIESAKLETPSLNMPELSVQIDATAPTSPESKSPKAEDIRVIDRQPDVVVLPELKQSISPAKVELNVDLPKIEAPAVLIKEKTETKPAKSSKPHTSFLDLPLIDILVPKSGSKAEKPKKEKKEKAKKEKEAKKPKETKSKAPVQAPKEIDMPVVLDFVVVEPARVELAEVAAPVAVEKVDKVEIVAEVPKITLAETNVEAQLPQVEIKLDAKPEINIEEPALEEKQATIDIPLTIAEVNIIEPAKLPEIKLEKVEIKTEKQQQSPEKKKKSTNAIDLPLIDILVPKEGKKSKKESNKKQAKSSDEAKVSCFSCKSKKLKKEKEAKVEPAAKPEPAGASVTVSLPKLEIDQSKKIDLTANLTNLDAPYVEVSKPVEVNALDADDLNKKLEELKVEIEKPVVEAELEIQKPEIELEEPKLKPDTEIQVETKEIEIDFEKPQIEIPLLAENNNIQVDVVETETKIFTNTQEFISNEVVEISKSIISQIESKTILNQQEPVEVDIKTEIPIIVKPEAEQPEPEIKAIDVPKVEVEVKKPKPAAEVTRKKKSSTTIDMPLIQILVPKSKETKAKEIKEDDGSKVSCFSCKSRKAKKEAKKQQVETSATIESKPVEIQITDDKNMKIVPEVRTMSVKSDFFKGLDKPSISEYDYIAHQQNFLESTAQKTEETNTAEQKQEQEEEAKSPELETVQEKPTEFTVTTETPSVSVEIPSVVDVPEVVQEAKVEVELEEAKVEPAIEAQAEAKVEIQNVFIPEIDFKQEVPRLLSDDPVKLPEPAEIKVDLTAPQAETKLPEVSVEVKKEAETKKDGKKAKKEKVKKVEKEPTTSCFMCKSSKKQKAKKDEPEAKPATIKVELPVVEVPEVVIQKPDIVIDSPAVVISGQPPKKPPRGHLDTTLIDVEVSAETPVLNVEIDQAKVEQPEAASFDIKAPIIQITQPSIEIVESSVSEPKETPTAAAQASIEISEIKIETPAPTVIVSSIVDTPKESQETKAEEKKETKQAKTKKAHTSIIDMPLIDILVPKGNKKEKPKKEKEPKKSKDKKSKKTENVTVAVDIKAPEVAIASPEVKISVNKPTTEYDPTLFKGLDPECITKTDKYPLTAAIVESPKVEIVKQEVEAKPEPIKEEPKPEPKKKEAKSEAKSADEPSIINLQKTTTQSDYVYSKPANLESWSTDPLPHVQIGLHKVGTNEQIKTSTLTKTTTTTTTTKPDEPPKTVTSTTTVIKEETKKIEITSPETVKAKVSTVQIIETTIDRQVTSTKTQHEEKVEAKTSTLKDDEAAKLLKSLSKEERKLIKSSQKDAVSYLIEKAGYNFKFDAKTDPKTKVKELKAKEKVIVKLFKRIIKITIKQRSKQITYEQFRKKLDKLKSSKLDLSEIDKCFELARSELENETLIAHLKTGKSKQDSAKQSGKQAAASSGDLDAKQNGGLQTAGIDAKQKSSSLDKLDEQAGVIRRFPSLTWREANERARILFYKGRVPSIHYNEKRDSFRVSMLAQVNTDGQERTTEVPVTDDDVRTLLNSCGLYWNGESISILNKSDEIFSNAQQEAFDLLQMLNTNNTVNDMFNLNITQSSTSNEPAQAEASNNNAASSEKQEEPQCKINFIH